MEHLPTEVLHRICLNLGYKQTLELCKSSHCLNDRISVDCLLWKKFSNTLTGNNSMQNGGCTKETFLSIQCFKLYLEIDLLERGHHRCSR